MKIIREMMLIWQKRIVVVMLIRIVMDLGKRKIVMENNEDMHVLNIDEQESCG